MNVWPATLPTAFPRGDLSTGLGDGRLRSQTDAGVAKLRRRFSYVPYPLSGSMVMTLAQLATFRSFVETDLQGGILPFEFPAQDGTGTWVVQFGDKLPTWSPMGVLWKVSLDLVILP
jgi:hypothetical protein